MGIEKPEKSRSRNLDIHPNRPQTSRVVLKTLLLPYLCLSFAFDAIAAPAQTPLKVYDVDPFVSRASVVVKYTFGTYLIPNTDVRGQMELHPTQVLSGVRVAFGIQGFRSGNKTLDCHLRESLGLDYSKSEFPDRHVCENDLLPSRGINSVRYPEIAFQSEDSNFDLAKVAEVPVEIEVNGIWRIHGIEKPEKVKLTIHRQGDGILVRGKKTFSLRDFGVTVKKFLFISVHDEVQAEWEMLFKPEKP